MQQPFAQLLALAVAALTVAALAVACINFLTLLIIINKLIIMAGKGGTEKTKGKKEKKYDEKKYVFWTDQIARQAIYRKKFLYLDKSVPKFKKFTVKTSASISGVLHIGRLSDTIRGEAVTRSLLDAGVDAEIIWVAEDMDPLRKVPRGVPERFVEYIGAPVTDIPDPWGCHKSYAEHHVSKYFEVIDDFVSLKMEKFSMREEYKKGNFNPYIKKLLENMDELVKIQNKYRSTPLPKGWAPWTPICENCGKIITPRVLKMEDGKVYYKCEDYQFEKYLAKGCGYEGVNDPLKGNGKLMWKSEWAAQWARWNIVSEGAGKEYQVPGSAFWVNAEICERILEFPAPVPIFYEHLIINGKKMSASIGNVVYPAEWLKHAPAELLRLLFLKDPMRERDFRWDMLPNMMDEYDELEKIYYGIKEVKSERKRYNAKRLFEMINVRALSDHYIPTVSFATLLEFVKALPSKNQLEFVLAQLKKLGLLKEITEETRERIEKRLNYAKAYIEAFGTPIEQEKKVQLSDEDKEIVRKLIGAIVEEDDAESLQNKIFELSKESGKKPSEFFKLIYQILFSSERGPRLGAYIIDAGKEEIIKKLKSVI